MQLYGMLLRSNTTVTLTPWQGVDKKDFGDTIFMMATLYQENEEKDLYNPKKKNALKFNPEAVAEWTKNKNREIRKIIADRKSGRRD